MPDIHTYIYVESCEKTQIYVYKLATIRHWLRGVGTLSLPVYIYFFWRSSVIKADDCGPSTVSLLGIIVALLSPPTQPSRASWPPLPVHPLQLHLLRRVACSLFHLSGTRQHFHLFPRPAIRFSLFCACFMRITYIFSDSFLLLWLLPFSGLLRCQSVCRPTRRMSNEEECGRKLLIRPLFPCR